MARFLIIALLLFNSAFAKDFGTRGNTFPISEQDLIEFLKNRVENLSDSQKTALQKQLQDHYSKRLTHPPSVNGIVDAEIYKTHYFDPTITVNQDIKDHEGNIIAKKGTTYNPLLATSLSQNLLFIDGSNESHVEWASNEPGAWILVKGCPLELEKKLEIPIYFDQGGVLCNRLNISHVPARVSQSGKYLKIEEIPVGGGE